MRTPERLYFIVLAALAVLFLAAVLGIAGGAQAQGCGCEMPGPLLTEPATPTPTPFATLAPPPGPCREHGCPRGLNAVFLPIVGGAP